MWKFIEMLSDICVIVFDLMLYVQMTTLRKNEKITKRISYAGCGVIVAFYILAVYVLNWPVRLCQNSKSLQNRHPYDII